MHKQILFIQGGGEEGYEADAALVNSLQTALGNDYVIHYPELNSDKNEPDFGWVRQIGNRISESKDDIILVGHSLGASMILKYLTENSVPKKIRGIFLIATPFWSGDEDWKKGLKLQENFADKVSKEIPLHFYHSQDDEVVPFSNFKFYRQKLTQATFHDIKSGGHQFNNDLTLVAKDITLLP